mgnify:CR=1 FL=1
MNRLSLIFKALSEPLRLHIVRTLLRSGTEAYGEELARALKIPAYRLSRHLKVLKAAGLIQERRQGRWVYYSLMDRDREVLKSLRRLIANADLPKTNGDSRPRRRRALRPRRRAVMAQEFNWNQGLAIPGVL